MRDAPPTPTWDARHPSQAGGSPLLRAGHPSLSSPTCHHLGAGPHSSALVVVAGWPPLPPREARASPSSAEAAGAAPGAGPAALPAASIVTPAKKENGAGAGGSM